MTVEGIVIYIADQHGRYHVPDQWVLNKKGKNFLVKLTLDSLSTSMEVVSGKTRKCSQLPLNKSLSSL
ncbi:hypothetical protein O9993_16600 [Vibrio lentus]|nr:hypothetical protein [Vibrio lentus]